MSTDQRTLLSKVLEKLLVQSWVNGEWAIPAQGCTLGKLGTSWCPAHVVSKIQGARLWPAEQGSQAFLLVCWPVSL